MNTSICKKAFIGGFRISEGPEAIKQEARTILGEVGLFLSAISGLLTDVGIKDEEIGAMSIVLGIDEVIDGTKAEFFKGIIADGPLGASPVIFPYTSPNAIAASVTMAFGIKGEDITFASGPLSFLKALSYGSFLVSNGFIETVLVCGVTGGKAASTIVGNVKGGVIISEVLEYKTADADAKKITSMAETFVLFMEAYKNAVFGGGSFLAAQDRWGNGIRLLMSIEASWKKEDGFAGIQV